MGRTSSTQRGASRRADRTTASRGGSTRRGGATSRTSAAKRGPKASSRAASKQRTKIPRPAGPWVPVAVVALVLVLGWALYPAMKLQYQSSRRAAGLEEQYRSLRERNAALSAEVAALKTPAGVEKAAREKLGYTKDGEHAYVVIPDGSTAASGVTTSSTALVSDPSVLQAVLDAIFGVSSATPAGVGP